MTAEAVPQRMEALALAQTTRMWRDGARTTVAGLPHREGRAAVAGLLVRRRHGEGADHLASLPVFQLLEWIYKWSPPWTRLVLDQAGIASEMRPVGELTERQRHALADALTDAERVG